jgi:hypothetical protein
VGHLIEAASAVATRQSNALAMPRPHELLVVFRSNMEAQLTYAVWPDTRSVSSIAELTGYSLQDLNWRSAFWWFDSPLATRLSLLSAAPSY